MNLLEFVFLTKEDGLIMGPISRLLGWILNGIYEFLAMFTDEVNGIGMANIALCIILFTIVVKVLMIPLTIKQQKSTKLSSQMSPELTAINEKYKGKTDEASRMKMQKETQAVYDKYGSNPMAGCLPLLVSMPILFALYRVIYAIPAYINDVYDMYELAAQAIQGIGGYAEALANFVTEAGISGISVTGFDEYETGKLTLTHIIDVLSKCNEGAWETLISTPAFSEISGQLTSYSEPIIEVHKFVGGMNILNNPVEKGNYFTIGLLIPILAMALQFLQTKISMAKTNKNNKKNADDPTMASMKMMNTFFPIMSGVICLAIPIGVGIYWIISSVVTIIITIFLNRYMDKVDVEELIAKNQAKRAKKLAKMGIETGNRMAEVAKTSTKSIEVEDRIKTTADYAKMVNKADTKDTASAENENNTTESTTTSTSGGSISSYANILKNRSGK
ncbi:MAG: YidC/Oxa1 family membrane protein insertase [Lachnospiraceae bacterium]|nr:YidC/Oxa1 family membrane protein insertase [Lachnospiraceae bacterium]